MEIDLDCDNIYGKCVMRKALVALYDFRKNNDSGLGSLGPAHFQDIDPFLAEFANENTIGDGLFYPTRPQRVVAIGDVHGDWLALLSSLWLGGIIDAAGHWIGGNAFVVQCGDFTDRQGRSTTVDSAANAREELDIVQYIHALDRAAVAGGGRVISTLGNHEVGLALHTTDEFSGYTTYQSDLGWSVKKKILFTPGGGMCLYLSNHCPLILQIHDYLFLHAGVTTAIVTACGWKDVPDQGKFPAFVNGKMHQVLQDSNYSGPLPACLSELLHTRDLSQPTVTPSQNATCVEQTQRLFTTLGLDWDMGGIVVGHTVQSDGIPYYCAGKIWRIDIGLSEAFGRKTHRTPLGVLEITFMQDHTQVKKIQNYQLTCSDGLCKNTFKTKTYHNGHLVGYFKQSSIRAG